MFDFRVVVCWLPGIKQPTRHGFDEYEAKEPVRVLCRHAEGNGPAIGMADKMKLAAVTLGERQNYFSFIFQ